MSDEERGEGKEEDLPTARDLPRWAGSTQRTIDFTARRPARFQAQSETDMQRPRGPYERNEERWARANERWGRAGESVRSLHAIAQMHEGEIRALPGSHSDTRERLDALTDTFERVIGERRNGGGKREEGSG